MKKFFYFVLAITVAAIAAVSCTKSEDDHLVKEEGGYYYTFTIDEGLTKATLGEEGVKWVDGDKVGMFIENASGEKVYYGYANVDVSTTPKSVILYSSNEIPQGSKAYAYYPYNEENKDNTPATTKISLISPQTGSAISTMPMAGIPFTVNTTVPVDTETHKAQTNGAIKFLNLGAIIEFQIYAQAYSSETVQYVTFTADTKKNQAGNSVNPIAVSGNASLDLSGINLEDESCLDLAFEQESSSNSVRVNQEVPVAATKDAASPVFMAIAPGTYTGTITVGTDVATYTFTFDNNKAVSLPRNVLKRFVMNLANAQRVEEVIEVVKEIPYSETFATSIGEFTTDGEEVANTAVWQFASGYGMKASARVNNTNYAAESWLTSPWIDLSDAVAAAASFDHVQRYAGTPANELTFWVLTDETNATWSQETIPTYSSGSNWTFVNAGEISLNEYVGKKVKVGFKYVSSTTASATWEIKNFLVEAKKLPSGIAYDEADQNKSAEIGQGSSFDEPVLINPHGLTITYSSSNSTVANVNATSGQVTIGNTVGVATITATFAGNDDYEAGSASYSITVTDPNAATVTDLLTRGFTGLNDGAGYTDWSGKQSNSDAVYAGNSAGGNNSIQLRSKNGTSGIITTSSGGYVTKITVTWQGDTQDGRTLDIYGKTTAYEYASDLYNDSKKGTLIGSIVKGTSTSAIITGDYPYVGLRSRSDAMYITEIDIEWSSTGSGVAPDPIISLSNTPTANFDVEGQNGVTVNYSIENPVTGISISASSNQTWVNSFAYTANTISFNVDPQPTTGTSVREATITVTYEGAESKTFKVKQDGRNPSGTVTVTKTMNQIVEANNYTVSAGTTIGDIVTSFNLDNVITVSTSGEPNCGTFWGSTTTTIDWRLYQQYGGDITISASSGYTISKLTITYTVQNSGKLKSGTTNINSNSEQTINASSITYTVGNTGDKTNGQVRVSQISVTYN